MNEESKYITLYELQSLIKQKIGASLPLPYWVVAEISEIKVNYSGHCYLELVEKGGANSVPRAKVNAVIWKSQYTMIASYFKSATGGDLKAGLKVLLKVMINYHEMYGLSFQITDIEPSYTIGDLEAQRRVTIERLQKEGIFDMNLESKLSDVIQRVAVVSSRNAAGYQDFVNELTQNKKGYKFDIQLFDTFMQGNEAEGSIVAALDAIASRADDFDVVVFIRGGGSQSDLGAFNSYKLCSHIAQFPLPVLTGIGHDKDKSVADLVSRVSLKTPTAVAGFIVGHNELFEARLDDALNYIVNFTIDSIAECRRNVDECAYHLGIAVRLDSHLSRVENISDRISTLAKSLISSQKREMELITNMIEAHNPDKILKRGFSIIRIGGKTANKIKEGDEIEIEMINTKVNANVTSVWKKR